jgi:membrane-anchored glycerophosphoryl diester phosphodiesterase (GDPDase)
MFERISRSWQLVKASWRILSQDRKLLVFPILSGICTLLVVVSFILPLVLSGAVFGRAAAGPAPWYVLLFLFYVVSYFVAIFFNTALITCVHSLLQGRETSITEGLSNAVRHIGPILAWAIVAATVGVILRAIQDRAGFLGRIAISIVGGIWSLVTIFVVPVLVLEDKGVVDAVKESVALFRKTWGESVVGSVSIGVIFGAIVVVGLIGVFAALFTRSITVMILGVALFILLIAVVSVVASAMQGIFVTALYTYAKTGNVPMGFGKGVLEKAFVPKEPVFGSGNI